MEPLFTNTYKMTKEVYSSIGRKIIKERKFNHIMNIVLNSTFVLAIVVFLISSIIFLGSDSVSEFITKIAPAMVIVVAFFILAKVLNKLIINSAYRATISLYGPNYEVTGNFYDDHFEEITVKSFEKYSYNDITAIYFSDNLLIFRLGKPGAILRGFLVDMNGFDESSRQAFIDFITSHTGLEVKK